MLTLYRQSWMTKSKLKPSFTCDIFSEIIWRATCSVSIVHRCQRCLAVYQGRTWLTWRHWHKLYETLNPIVVYWGILRAPGDAWSPIKAWSIDIGWHFCTCWMPLEGRWNLANWWWQLACPDAHWTCALLPFWQSWKSPAAVHGPQRWLSIA